MGVYKKAVITNAGRALMARSIAGEIVMQFSRAVTSSHIYPSDTDFKSYISLEGIQQTVIPSNVQVVNDTLISVRALFGNESISESYLIQNIGLYATDGNEEILFSVSQATTPDEMPAYNGVAPSAFIYTIQNAVLQANSLSLTINPAGTATTQDILDLDGAKLEIDGDISETVVETLEPVVEDKFPIPSAGERIKQFLGKVLTFLRNIKPFQTDETYYVATSGSDTTGDGTSTKPFRTIQHVIDALSKNLGGHIVTINIASGTYAEALNICGFYAGLLIISGSDASTTIIEGATEQNKLYDSSARIQLQNICLKASNIIAEYESVIAIYNCTSVSVLNTNLDGQNLVHPLTNNRGYAFIASTSELENCIINNCDICIYTPIFDNLPNPPSFISVCKLSGTGNVYGCAIHGGQLLFKDSFRPQSANGNVVEHGGIIANYSGAIIGSLSADLAIYVSTTGSDITGDGSSSNPFKTIKFVIDGTPKDLGGHVLVINVANGTYTEDVFISGFHSGVLSLVSSTPTTVTANVKVQHVSIADCSAYITVEGIKCVSTTGDAAVYVYRSTNVWLGYLSITDIATPPGVLVRASALTRVNGCDITGKSTAIVYENSGGYISGCTGSSNTIGIASSGSSEVHVIGVTPGATTARAQYNGGMFIESNGTQISEVISSGLSCTWGALTGGYVRHGNRSGGTAMITLSMRIVTTSALSANTDYQVTGFPTNATVAAIAVASSRPSDFGQCWLSNGTLHIVPVAAHSTSYDITFNATYPTAS